jgi:hypothetical protein
MLFSSPVWIEKHARTSDVLIMLQQNSPAKNELAWKISEIHKEMKKQQ